MRCARPEPTSTGNWLSSWPGMENAAPWFGASPMRASGRSPDDDKNEKDDEVHREHPDELIEEATTDAYSESEQAGGFFAMIEENLSLPFVTRVLGQEVTSGHPEGQGMMRFRIPFINP